MRARLSLTALTAIALRAGRGTGEAQTLSYLPGTVLWGGLASAHGILRADRREQFADFFLRGKVSFGNLYPARFDHAELDDDTQPVYPLPRTARTCKRFPGFLFAAEREREPRHGIYDSLIPWAIFALGGDREDAPIAAHERCTSCGGSADRAEGFYRRGFEPGQAGKARIRKAIVTRTGISPATGTAAQGILYSREILQQGSRFWGTIAAASDELYVALRGFADEAADAGLLRLGTNRTRGLGRAVIAEFTRYEEESAVELEARARVFDEKLRAMAEQVGVAAPHGFYLPITLVSDAILVDQLMRNQLQLTGDYLAAAWGLAGAELIYQNAGRRRLVGWSDLWGLPKAEEWAITMGSVFLVGLPAEPDFAVLARMQSEGIGTRRAEGFGQVRVADPFHQEVSAL